MDFPVSIPWETLDPEILQKAINSGSNYRTYCDEKSWDISFEIEFLEKEEIIFLLLIEHGRRKGGTSVQKTNERTEISKYTKEEQAKMVNAFLIKNLILTKRGTLCLSDQRQVCLEIMCMNPIWTICIPGITWAT